MRTKESFDRGWMYKIGEVGPLPVPKTSAKSALLGGLTSSLPGEKGEAFPGATRVMALLKNILPKGKEQEKAPESGALTMLAGPYARARHSLEGWKPVDLPHDFRLELGFTRDPESFGQGYIPNGVCYYRKTFPLPKEDEGRRIVLEFDGVMRAASFWFNGCFVGDTYSGYCGFQYDVSELARYGEEEGDNVLLVRVDTTTGNEGWWYEGGGIYRHTWLTKYAPVHIDRWGVYVKTQVQGADAAAAVEATVCNENTESCLAQVRTTLLGPDGRAAAVAEAQGMVPAGGKVVLTGSAQVQGAQLWSCESPSLYTARTQVLVGGEVVDEYDTTFGFRTVEYTLEGLKLNGRVVPLYGACVHQDFAGVGVALPDAVQHYKVRRLREMGINAYRSSHNAATIELLDECDRQGMLVLDENRLIETTPHRLRDLEELIKRGRNHPSIFAWSLSNEELFSGSEMAMRIIRRMLALARSLDDTRPYVAAEAFIPEDAAPLYCRPGLYDVLGLNYAESTSMADGRFARIHAASPEVKVLNTENTSWYSTRGIYEDNKPRGHCSSYGTRYAMMGGEGGPSAGGTARPQQTWHFYRDNPMTGGFFIWTGFDYRGEPTPLRETQVASNFGVMDLCGFAKDDYYYYQSLFLSEPVLHIMPHWNWAVEGEVKQVRLYTNCDEAELFLNGESLGRKAKEGDWIRFDVPFRPGELKAVGYRGGQPVREDKRVTAGVPARLRLCADKPALAADGADVAFVTVEVCDDAGNLVPTAETPVTVQVGGCGRLLGLGNGDPGSRENDKAASRSAFSGLLMALVQATGQAGEVQVRVSAPGLQGACLALRAE